MNARFERNQGKIELNDDSAAAASSQTRKTKLEPTQPNVSTKFEKIDPDYLDDDSKYSSSSSSSSLFYESDEEKSQFSDEEENDSELKKSVEEFGINKKFFKVKNPLFYT